MKYNEMDFVIIYDQISASKKWFQREFTKNTDFCVRLKEKDTRKFITYILGIYQKYSKTYLC